MLVAIARCGYQDLSSRRGVPPVDWHVYQLRSIRAPACAAIFLFLETRTIFAANVAKLDAPLIFLAETVETLFLPDLTSSVVPIAGLIDLTLYKYLLVSAASIRILSTPLSIHSSDQTQLGEVVPDLFLRHLHVRSQHSPTTLPSLLAKVLDSSAKNMHRVYMPRACSHPRFLLRIFGCPWLVLGTK